MADFYERTLRDQIQSCYLCDLSKHRVQAVPGEGSPQAKVFFIGEAPGAVAERAARPWIGVYGEVLNAWLDYLRLPREEVYLTNAVKCRLRDEYGRPRSGYGPALGEMRACSIWLCREIASVQPRLIVTVGASAVKALLLGDSLDGFRRKSYSRDEGNVTYFALYHPALVQRGGSLRIPTSVSEDLDKLRLLLEVTGILR